jgi:hypothetical protein
MLLAVTPKDAAVFAYKETSKIKLEPLYKRDLRPLGDLLGLEVVQLVDEGTSEGIGSFDVRPLSSDFGSDGHGQDSVRTVEAQLSAQ